MIIGSFFIRLHILGLDGQDRSEFKPFTWNEEDGTPFLGELYDPNIPISLPQDEPPRQRYQLDSPVQNPTFAVQVDNTGSYIAVIQVCSKESTKGTNYRLTVNQNDVRTANVLYSDNWSSILISVRLQKGKNTLAFLNTGSARGEIFSLDILSQTSE